MKKTVFRKTVLLDLSAAIKPGLLTLAVACTVMYGLEQTERSSRAEGLRILEDGIRRAVVTCYAAEGSYPESVSYITEHYGVYIDTSKYTVHYEIFASNIFPIITVIDLNSD